MNFKFLWKRAASIKSQTEKLPKSIHFISSVKTFHVKNEWKHSISSKRICGYSILFWLWKSFENKVACPCLFSICKMSAVSTKWSVSLINLSNKERTALLEDTLNLPCFPSITSCFSARIYVMVGWWHKYITSPLPSILHCCPGHTYHHSPKPPSLMP